MLKAERFKTIHQEGSQLRNGIRQIIVDKETGVNYLFTMAGNAGGLTPLTDKDGKPVITIIDNKN